MPHRRHAGTSYRHEVIIGRTAAVCLHPVAAWRSTMRAHRALLVAGYFLTGYVATLVTIATLR